MSEFKTALPDRILLNIEKPARYTGAEINSVIKDKNKVDIRFAMCFPDIYEIGMSHLGAQIIYSMLNEKDYIWCERVFSPWFDLHKIMKDEDIPLFTLESQSPVKDMDFLGITLQYEMCYTNVLQILDLSKIPFYSNQRDESFPIVIGGGPCAYNPEPLADFFDLFYIGEGETVYYNLLDLYRENKKEGKSKKEFLLKAASIPGIYVPSLYKVSYNEDGTISSFKALDEYKSLIPGKIIKQTVSDFSGSYFPEKPVIPYLQITQDRAVLEVMRGCIRGCRFCQAGMIYRPCRPKNADVLKKQALLAIENSGYEEISLSSLSTSDYPQLKELLDFLLEEFPDIKLNVSLPSLRIDDFSLDIMSRIQDVKKSSLTFAPEAGTQKMRDIINKGITQEDIIEGSRSAFEGGWNKVKLYFMLGLPEETDDDIFGIAELANEIAKTYYDTVPKEKRSGKVMITVSTSFFIPKPFTAFQWQAMLKPEDYLAKAHTLNDSIKEKINKKSIRYNWHDAKTSVIEGLLARGDRKISRVIEDVYNQGEIFSSWTEYFDYEKWINAMLKEGLSLDFYVFRQRDLYEILPWDFIDTGVTKSFLIREYKNALNGKVTPNCKEKCSGCGAAVFNGGVCFENKN